MPFGYSGSKDPKKSRKDGTRGSSAASVLSHSSQSTGKGLNSFVENPKREKEPSHSRAPSTGLATKTPGVVTRSPAKLTDANKKDTGVFEYLDEEDDDDDDESEESSSSSEPDDEDDAVGAQPRTTTILPGTIGLQLARGSRPNGAPALQPSPYNETEAPKKDTSLLPQDKKELDFSTMPDTYYTQRNSAPSYRPSFPPSPPKSPEDSYPKKQQKLRKTHHTKPKKIASGYGFIAPRIKVSPGDSKDRLPPLYRRFEHLNHRVLLHLQDEIAELEEDLHTLDELEEGYRSSTAEREKHKPASRRLDAQAQSNSTLHSRRQGLMEMLIQKTEQYNNALYAYTRVIQNLPRASEPDIKTYRTWMKERKPIAAAETRFLDHDKDLVSITPYAASPMASTSFNKLSSPSIFPAIIIASTAILLPLLAFSMVSEFTGRLVLVAIVGGAASAVAGNYSTGTEQLVDAKDGWRCATIYFGFMTVAAMFIP